MADLTVAFLGPRGTFSHEAVRGNFAGCQEMVCGDFDDIMECVIHGECDFGLTPFENSNCQSIIPLQLSLAAHKSQIFVTDLIPHHVRLNLYGWGSDLSAIQEVRSISVAFQQATAWLATHLPQARHIGSYSSTAAAIQSLNDPKSSELAALGGKDGGNVPIIARDIQTEPNITIFCRVEKEAPDWSEVEHVLLGIPEYEERDFDGLLSLLLEHSCCVTANWVLDRFPHRVGMFELGSVARASRLRDVCAVIQRRLPKAFLVGGYANRSITTLEYEKHRRI